MNNKDLYADDQIQKKLPLFFKNWWLDTVSDSWDVALVKKQEHIVAVFPYSLDKRISFQLIRNPKITAYLGPYFLKKLETSLSNLDFQEKILESLWKQIPKYDYFQIDTLPEFQHFHFFHKLNIKNKARLTYYIDLEQSEGEIFSKFHARRRNYIRKAEKELIFEKINNPDIPLFIKWQKPAFEQKGQKYPYDFHFLTRIIKASERNKASDFWIAKTKDNEIAAMLWTPFDSEKMYHLLSTFNPEIRINGAMDALVWNAIKSAKSKNLRIYDFEGSMDSGIESFFRKFGGERKVYFSFEDHKSFLWKLKKNILG